TCVTGKRASKKEATMLLLGIFSYHIFIISLSGAMIDICSLVYCPLHLRDLTLFWLKLRLILPLKVFPLLPLSDFLIKLLRRLGKEFAQPLKIVALISLPNGSLLI